MFLAWAPTPEFWALLGVIATMLSKQWYEIRRDARAAREAEEKRLAEITEREQNRLDIAALAVLTAEQVENIKRHFDENGQLRLKRLLESNATTRLYTKKALDTANGVNAKIEALGQTLVDAKQNETNS